MDISATTSSSGGGTGRQGESPFVSGINTSASRRVNFKQSAAQPGVAGGPVKSPEVQKLPSQASLSRQGPQPCAPTSSKAFQPSAPPRGPTFPLRPMHSRADGVAAEQPQSLTTPLSFARVQAAGGAQRSLGNDPDYWAYTAPPAASAANRIFSFPSRQGAQPVTSEPPAQDGPGLGRRTGSIERLIGTDIAAAKQKEAPVGTTALRQALNAVRGTREDEPLDEVDEFVDWQEPEEDQEDQGAREDVAGAVWKKRIARTSTHYPICSRTDRVGKNDIWAQKGVVHAQELSALKYCLSGARCSFFLLPSLHGPTSSGTLWSHAP